MPFMPNGAEVAPSILRRGGDRPGRPRTPCSAPPNNKVSAADYAIGLHASSLVVDGGTLQIGIGSLGDAIARR
jgi:acyl-CoA hydrolase